MPAFRKETKYMQDSFIVFLKLNHFCGGVTSQLGGKNVTTTYEKVKNTLMYFSNFCECKIQDTSLCPAEVFISLLEPASFVLAVPVYIYCLFFKWFCLNCFITFITFIHLWQRLQVNLLFSLLLRVQCTSNFLR